MRCKNIEVNKLWIDVSVDFLCSLIFGNFFYSYLCMFCWYDDIVCYLSIVYKVGYNFVYIYYLNMLWNYVRVM